MYDLLKDEVEKCGVSLYFFKSYYIIIFTINRLVNNNIALST
jgi:hypothetical protein